jgi:uncharacterized protein YutE (UPF0331/DUF86 family)
MDRERIYAKIDEMEQYPKELCMIIPESLDDYRASIKKRWAIERLLQITIEAVMDTCALLVRELKLGLPSVEGDLLEKLRKKVLEPSLVENLKQMRAFRKILVHGYSKIDDEKVFNIFSERLKDFEEFKCETIRFLDKKVGEI